MRKVVQLCSFESIYNDKLQEKLRLSEKFCRDNELICICLKSERDKYYNARGWSSDCPKNYIRRFIRLVSFTRWFNKHYKFDNKCDVVNVQFVSRQMIYLTPFILHNFQKIVLSFWGSDLLRENNLILFLLRKLVHNATYITVETNDMKKIFMKKFSYHDESKIKFVRFGSPTLECIDKCTEEQDETFRKKFDIPDNKKIIVIGYNNREGQQHIKAIDSIYRNNISPSDIFIILPWTYGDSTQLYKKEVENHLTNKYDYTFIEERMTDEEVASLRRITDVMIQIQITDSFSASMMETLYAGNKIITGKWLPYDSLIKMGISINLVEKPEDVGKHLKEKLYEKEDVNTLTINKRIVYEMCSWEKNLQSWISLY